MSSTPPHPITLPPALAELEPLATAIPRLAKDPRAMAAIEAAVQQLPTEHRLLQGDARDLSFLPERSIHLVVTSPPYWTLKRYPALAGQLGALADYECFLAELARVWRHCWRVLVPGGRLICVVGDVCLSRRANGGRHTVVPLHAAIQEQCRALGFDNLTPIIWRKIANATYEAGGAGTGFLGKPYEPNAVIKNDCEYLLMQRKPGGYRHPPPATRVLSIIAAEHHRRWFQPVWTDITGAATGAHPAPYPVALATRLIRMFSFVGDTVLDPFLGSGTTAVAAARCGRHSLGVEIAPAYHALALQRLRQEGGPVRVLAAPSPANPAVTPPGAGAGHAP